MRQVFRLLQVGPAGVNGACVAGELDECEKGQNLAGYILERAPALTPQGMVWHYLLCMAATLGKPTVDAAGHRESEVKGARQERLRLRPIGRLAPLGARQFEPVTSPTVYSLRPVRSGETYRITSLPERELVRPELAAALETIFERFARKHSLTAEKPLGIHFSRGFKAGSPGHGEGRAADIAAAGGKSLLEWKQEWERAMAAAEKLSDPQQRAEAIAAEQKRNLGYGLYKALQEHGGWRVDPKGWRPYRGVMQLFGPWTAIEGPWKAMQIEAPNPYQRQRLADQQWVLQAHHDHIHVAR